MTNIAVSPTTSRTAPSRTRTASPTPPRKASRTASPTPDRTESPAAESGDVIVRRIVITTTGAIFAFAFAFSFFNAWKVARDAEVSALSAPMIQPVVELSALTLVGLIPYLQRRIDRAPADLRPQLAEQLRPARKVLHLSGLIMVALAVAKPLADKNFDTAALDAICPVLALLWAKIGPDLLRLLYTPTAESDPSPTAESDPSPTVEAVAESDSTGRESDRSPIGPARQRRNPRGRTVAAKTVPTLTVTEAEKAAAQNHADAYAKANGGKQISQDNLRMAMGCAATKARHLHALLFAANTA